MTPTPPLIQVGQRAFFYNPFDLNSQLLFEGVMAMLFVAVGVSGGLLAHRSLRSPAGGRQSSILLLIGALMLIIGILGINALLELKLSPGV